MLNLLNFVEVEGTRIQPLDGQVLDGGKTNLNWSDIRDKAIRLAAKYTDSYASDILYALEAVEAALNSKEKEGLWFLGFRENGVDHNEYIEHTDEATVELYYRSVWCIKLETVTKYDFPYVRMSIYKVDYYPWRKAAAV